MNQSRAELLTDKERERLATTRDTIDSKTRSMNDARVKRKLAAWRQNFGDIKLILDNLPEDLITAVISDEDIYKLFSLTEKMLSIRNFSPIDGRIHDEHWLGYRGEVNDLDIWRSYNVYKHLLKLYDHFGHRNPFWDNYHLLEVMAKDEEFKYRITPEERRGMERIERAKKSFSDRDPSPVHEVVPSVLVGAVKSTPPSSEE